MMTYTQYISLFNWTKYDFKTDLTLTFDAS